MHAVCRAECLGDTLLWDDFPQPPFLGIHDKGLKANIVNNETVFLWGYCQYFCQF